MTITIEDRTFAQIVDRSAGRRFADLSIQRCLFDRCALSARHSAGARNVVERVSLVDCKARQCTVGNAVLRDVLIKGLSTAGLLQAWGAVFERVTIEGPAGRVMLSPHSMPTSVTPVSLIAQQKLEAADFYARCGWALDISRAEFMECEIRGIPASVIRRDPTTQAVVRLKSVLEGRWRALPLGRTYWPAALEHATLESQDALLIAPLRAPDFDELMAGIRLLRAEGIAEPS